MPPATPPTIGKFEVLGELGRGGMGVVHLARDLRLDRLVAIKAIIPELAGDPRRVAMFRDEARLIAQLNHPHIAQLHQLVEEEGELYLVMEYIPGQSLREKLAGATHAGGERRGIEPALCRQIMSQVASALEAAHARRIVHRDLKPENVRIADDGTAKVLDFGLATALPEGRLVAVTPVEAAPDPRPAAPQRGLAPSTAPPTVAATGGSAGSSLPTADLPAISPGSEAQADPSAPSGAGTAGTPARPGRAGTPGYMAPEQWRGESVDARTDVFAFGCLLFECLSGERAFAGRTVDELFQATLATDPDLARLPSDLPAEVVALARSCLERDPARRRADLSGVARLLAGEAPKVERTSAPAAVAGNISRPFDRFVGRAEELAELALLVRERPLVTLCGSGGCGKTRLAVELGRRLVDRFAGGVWIALLAPAGDAGLVAGAVAAALGVKDEPATPLPDALARRLTGAPTLLILDNCEHVLGAASALVSALLAASPALRVVATSREPLGAPGEHVWRVPGLAVAPRALPRGSGGSKAGAVDDPLASEAVALFIERAREVRPAFQPTAEGLHCIARICRRLDGLPLAIELAAARMKTLAPEEVESRLDQRFKMLRAGRAREDRHQTLRATVDWSYRLLSDEEKRLLRWLSVFAGGCTLEAARRVVGGDDADEFEMLDLLTQLIDKSLVDSEESAGVIRFRLLETVRQYGLEELDRVDETREALARFVEYHAALADQWGARLEGPEMAAGLRCLAAEHDNFVAAIAGAGIVGDACAALRICAGLDRDWQSRGCLGFARDACAAALSLPGAEPCPGPRAAALLTAAGVARRRSEWDQARIFAEEAASLAKSTPDSDLRRAEGRAMCMLGMVATYEGDIATAERLYAEATRLAGAVADDFTIARARTLLGVLRMQRADNVGARESLSEGRAIAERLGNAQLQATILINLGMVSRREGDLAASFGCYREGLAIVREIGDRVGFPYYLEHAAMLAVTCGDHDRAAGFLGAAAQTRGEMGVPAEPWLAAETEPFVTAARAALGESGFDSAVAVGLTREIDDSLAALGDWLAQPPRGA